MQQPGNYDKIKAEGGPYDSLIQAASEQQGVPYDLLHKQIFLESSFNAKAVSPTGPRGLAQMTRATGLAYGLERDEDFFDPTKSIDAAARHMKDNIKMAGGDQLKALLMYNQGAGPKGSPQLQAYDRGDFSGVSDEGLNYMRKLMDVTNTGKKAELDGFVKPAGGFEAPAGLEAQPKATPDNAPDTFASFGFQGKDIAPKAPTFAQELFATTGKTEETDPDGLFYKLGETADDALQNSQIGVMVRAASQGAQDADFMSAYQMAKDVFNAPFEGGRLERWEEADYENLRNSKLDPQLYDVVLRGRKQDFQSNLALAMRNQELSAQAEGAGIGSQLLGGAAGIPLDPWTYVAPGKGAAGGLGARLTGGALAGGALGGLSEHGVAKASGREEHLGMAIAGGAAFGGVLNGLLGARPARNSWDGPAPLEGELLGPEGGPTGLAQDVPRLEADSLEGMLGQLQLPNPEAPLKGAIRRLQMREAARLADGEDPSAMPFRDGEEIKETPAGRYIDVPFDPEAARTADGSILSGGNPINPKTLETFKDLDQFGSRANPGFKLGGETEIGFKLAYSKNPEIRGLAYDLFRSTTGYQTGSNGKFGATASDIVERLRSQDNVAHNAFSERFDEILKDPYWRAQDGTSAGKRETASRRIVEAMESNGASKIKLTPAETQLLTELRDHMSQKWDYIENPGQFGNLNAKSLLEESRHAGSYYPQRYSTAAKQEMIRRLGSGEALQEAISRSWPASYMKRPEVRARVDKMIQERAGETPMTPEAIREAVAKYANDKAYGIAQTEQFNRSSLLDEHLDDGVGIENNDYLEARNLFDSDVEINLPDGSLFSVNDLREFDIMRVVPQYDRRVNGDVALMGGTGKTTKQIKDMATKMQGKGESLRSDLAIESSALMEALKMFTGRARRDPDDAWATAARSLNDIGFATKNAYMGIQNFTEAASIIVKGHQKMLLKGIPVLKRWTTAKEKLEPEDIKQMHGLIFGRELDDILRPTRQDIVDRLRQTSSLEVSQVAGSIKWATGELAARSPFTWLLRESGNYILDAGRQGLMVDLIDHTLNKTSSTLYSPERLRSASITPEQFKGIQALIRKHFRQDPESGKWRIENAEAMAADTRSMDLWRLGDRIADETMLRPHKMSSASMKAGSAYWDMALQFKRFVLRTLNSRVIRGWAEATRNGQALDQGLQVLVSLGLATGFYAASTQLKAISMPDRARKEYLDKAMTPGMLAYAGISRSSHVGAPLGVLNFFTAPFGYDQAAMVRTSILPRDPKEKQGDKPIKFSPLQSDLMTGFMGRVGEQVPAAGVVGYGAQAANGAIHLLRGDRRDDLQGHRTGMYNALKQFVPNDPATQFLMQKLAESQGVEIKR